MAQSGDGKIQWVLDNNPVSANYDVQLPDTSGGSQYPLKGTASFTYVTSGKLRTVTLTATLNSSGESPTYDFSAKVEESGDDTYYLPYNVASLKSGATKEVIEAAFGGEGMFTEAAKAASSKKKLYIYQSALGLIPVSAATPFVVLGYFSFLYNDAKEALLKYVRSDKVTVSYPSGYPLNPQLYSLTSSSDTDEISTAVGGESGLKEIIQAVKDGNRLVIRGTLDSFSGFNINQDLQCNMYQEKENGDISLFLSGTGYGLWGGAGGIMCIEYIKSSNTFQCQAMTT